MLKRVAAKLINLNDIPSCEDISFVPLTALKFVGVRLKHLWIFFGTLWQSWFIFGNLWEMFRNICLASFVSGGRADYIIIHPSNQSFCNGYSIAVIALRIWTVWNSRELNRWFTQDWSEEFDLCQ